MQKSFFIIENILKKPQVPSSELPEGSCQLFVIGQPVGQHHFRQEEVGKLINMNKFSNRFFNWGKLINIKKMYQSIFLAETNW